MILNCPIRLRTAIIRHFRRKVTSSHKNSYLCNPNAGALKKLNHYIIKSFVGTFLFTFFIVIFILLLQRLWLYIDDMVGKGLEASVFVELFFYMCITFIPMALPLALLFATIMCYGNFGEHYELVAMKASGISIWRAMKPVMFFSIFLSIFAFWISNSVIPVATLKAQTLLWDVRRQKLAFDIKEGVYYRDLEDYVIYVNKKGDDGSSIYGVKIYDHTKREGNTQILSADSGKMELSANQRNIVFTLYNGYNYTEVTSEQNYRQKRTFERMSFKEEQIKFSLKDFDMTRSDEEIYKTYHEMMNLRQLSAAMDSLTVRRDDRQALFTESFENRYRNLMATRQPFDTLHQADADTLFLLQWPLLDNMDGDIRAKSLELAVGAAQNAKDNVEFHQSDFKTQAENLRKHKKQWHKIFTLSIACLIFFFIGAPLGTLIRKGGLGLPTVISVLFFVIYYVTSTTLERVAVAGDLNMFLGVWLSSIILLPVGIFLTFKATSDSALLDADSWRNFFKKLTHRHPKS